MASGSQSVARVPPSSLEWPMIVLLLFALIAAPAHGQVQAAAAQSSDHFDANAATSAYLATVPPEKRLRSDAYYVGGYWLILWDTLASAAVYVLLLGLGWSARMRDAAERLADIARQCGARLLTERPAPALDLGTDFFAPPQALHQRCADQLRPGSPGRF